MAEERAVCGTGFTQPPSFVVPLPSSSASSSSSVFHSVSPLSNLVPILLKKPPCHSFAGSRRSCCHEARLPTVGCWKSPCCLSATHRLLPQRLACPLNMSQVQFWLKFASLFKVTFLLFHFFGGKKSLSMFSPLSFVCTGKGTFLQPDLAFCLVASQRSGARHLLCHLAFLGCKRVVELGRTCWVIVNL